MKYCLSNAASQVATELVNIMTAQQNRSRKEFDESRILSIRTNEKCVQQILDSFAKDIEDGKIPVVSCEDTVEPDDLQIIEHESSNIGGRVDNLDNSIYRENNTILIQLLNPQINFNSQDDGNSAVIVTARQMQIKILSLMDCIEDQTKLGQDEQNRVVKFQNVWSLEQAQFLVQDGSRDMQIISQAFIRPLWVPIESFFDETIPIVGFTRVVEKTEVLFQTSSPNPFYVQRNARDTSNQSHTTYTFKISSLQVLSSSRQYVILYDLFQTLLIYRDPDGGDQADRAKNMLFALEQCEDIETYRYAVLSLQEKIRWGEFLLKNGTKFDQTLSKQEVAQVRVSNNNYRSELYVLMESLKNLQIIESKRRSFDVSWELRVEIDNFVWTMIHDLRELLCRWTVDRMVFIWLNNEDQSSCNTLKIDTSHVVNLTQSSVFLNILGPYNHGLPSERDKMLRIYWRENAPVAGIQVVAHFEINVRPLLIQMTYEFGKQIADFIFPPEDIAMKDRRTINFDSRFNSNRASQTSTFSRNLNDRQKLMQSRAISNKSFIYIKMPGVQHCLSYRGSKEKNIEDLTMFTFYLPTLEYRNQTWTWFDFLEAVKKGIYLFIPDALRAALSNTGALVREKFFMKQVTHQRNHSSSPSNLRIQDIEGGFDSEYVTLALDDTNPQTNCSSTIANQRHDTNDLNQAMIRPNSHNARASFIS